MVFQFTHICTYGGERVTEKSNRNKIEAESKEKARTDSPHML